MEGLIYTWISAIQEENNTRDNGYIFILYNLFYSLFLKIIKFNINGSNIRIKKIICHILHVFIHNSLNFLYTFLFCNKNIKIKKNNKKIIINSLTLTFRFCAENFRNTR